jgi:excisionase family DNA binding protein
VTLLRLSDAAKALTISKSSLERLIRAGRIRVVHPTPGTTRITSAEIDAYIASISSRKVA